jgi:hypothetical protein
MCCPRWRGERRRVLGPGMQSQTAKWRKLTGGGSLSLAFLRKVSGEFKEVTEESIVPWVAVLGKEGNQGGIETLVVEVAKWLEV